MEGVEGRGGRGEEGKRARRGGEEGGSGGGGGGEEGGEASERMGWRGFVEEGVRCAVLSLGVGVVEAGRGGLVEWGGGVGLRLGEGESGGECSLHGLFPDPSYFAGRYGGWFFWELWRFVEALWRCIGLKYNPRNTERMSYPTICESYQG